MSLIPCLLLFIGVRRIQVASYSTAACCDATWPHTYLLIFVFTVQPDVESCGEPQSHFITRSRDWVMHILSVLWAMGSFKQYIKDGQHSNCLIGYYLLGFVQTPCLLGCLPFVASKFQCFPASPFQQYCWVNHSSTIILDRINFQHDINLTLAYFV